MAEFLAFYILVGIVVNQFAIVKFHSNPPALEIMGAILMWPLVLFSVIASLLKPKE